jgi:hypothetical protein
VWLYCTHLGASDELSQTDAGQRDQVLLAQIAKTRRMLQSDESWRYPGTIGRCLMLAIRDEDVDSLTLDRILAPYWPALWGLAARGHWIRTRRPVRAGGAMEDDVRQQISLPEKATVGDLTITWTGIGRPELGLILHFGRPRGFSVMFYRYPEFVEFRTMLEGLRDGKWHGRHFLGAVTTAAGAKTYEVTGKSSDVWFDLTENEWTTMRDLILADCKRPELARWLWELWQEYGEQG